ncbi:hypothetical protein [Paraburkholderia sp. J11-2]|uniref:hypothetical protein n=1 Tax=Paraburkholderia sp. J11-2 TaxID=2805431 RepID=UPI002AB6BC49|nr:hypothetical protein [Paraburkholderia sp. J11-2]
MAPVAVPRPTAAAAATDYGPPAITGTGSGAGPARASNNYGPPAGMAGVAKTGFAVDTGGYEPPILTPTRSGKGAQEAPDEPAQ